MATNLFDPAEIELRRQLLREELANLEAEKIKSIGTMQVVDYHHPERSPGWPIYRHQPFPQLLYHPTEKDPAVEQRRLGLRRRNEANPHLAPMDIPPSEPLTLKVNNQAEKDAAIERGYGETVPGRQKIDANSPLEMIGAEAENPLQPQPAAAGLSVEEILKLNAMPKDDLLQHASERYGITVAEEASKLEIIRAIERTIQGEAHVATTA